MTMWLYARRWERGPLLLPLVLTTANRAVQSAAAMHYQQCCLCRPAMLCLLQFLSDTWVSGAMQPKKLQPKPLQGPFAWVKKHIPWPAACLHWNCTGTGGPK